MGVAGFAGGCFLDGSWKLKSQFQRPVAEWQGGRFDEDKASAAIVGLMKSCSTDFRARFTIALHSAL